MTGQPAPGTERLPLLPALGRVSAVRQSLRDLGARPEGRAVLAAAAVDADLAAIDDGLAELTAILSVPPRPDTIAD